MKQEAQGKLTNLKGRIKEAAGVVSGNRKLEDEGAQERTEGAVQESIGTARRKIGKLIGNIGKKIDA